MKIYYANGPLKLDGVVYEKDAVIENFEKIYNGGSLLHMKLVEMVEVVDPLPVSVPASPPPKGTKKKVV